MLLAWSGAEQELSVVRVCLLHAACSCSAAGGYTMQRGCGADYRHDFGKLIFVMGFWGEELQLRFQLRVFGRAVVHLRA